MMQDIEFAGVSHGQARQFATGAPEDCYVTHNGFSDRRSRPFRINVFITPTAGPAGYGVPWLVRKVGPQCLVEGPPPNPKKPGGTGRQNQPESGGPVLPLT